MTLRNKVSLTVLAGWLVTAAVWPSAQVVGRPGAFRDPLDLVAPTVISGGDLGFRIESIRDNIAVGKFVVRVDGHWIDAQVGSGGVIATAAR